MSAVSQNIVYIYSNIYGYLISCVLLRWRWLFFYLIISYNNINDLRHYILKMRRYVDIAGQKCSIMLKSGQAALAKWRICAVFLDETWDSRISSKLLSYKTQKDFNTLDDKSIFVRFFVLRLDILFFEKVIIDMTFKLHNKSVYAYCVHIYPC